MKDQFVIACLPSPDYADTVLPWARLCSQKLGKGIIVLNVSKEGESADDGWLKQYGIPFVGLHGDWKTAVDGLPTAFSGVLAVTPVDPKAPRSSIANPATMLRTFADCKIAYLALHSPLSAPHSPLSTYLTLDHRRESKEKLIWGSYMVRFFGMKLNVVAPQYKDQGLLARQRNNMRFLDKMYKSLGVDYQILTPPITTVQNPDLLTLDTYTPDILVAMTTDRRDRDVGDWLLGPPERRLLAHASRTPLLFINQRDDLYVLCD